MRGSTLIEERSGISGPLRRHVAVSLALIVICLWLSCLWLSFRFIGL